MIIVLLLKSLLARTANIGAKREEYCKYLSNTMGWAEDECYTVCTGADFFCEDGER